MSDKTQAQPCKVNVVISWWELHGTWQLHQGIFPSSQVHKGLRCGYNLQTSEIQQGEGLVLHFGPIVTVHLSRESLYVSVCCGLGGQLPAALSFPYLDVCTCTAQIFLSCSSHEFTFKDYFLKTFYLLKCAVSIGRTCSQGYHPRINS